MVRDEFSKLLQALLAGEGGHIETEAARAREAIVDLHDASDDEVIAVALRKEAMAYRGVLPRNAGAALLVKHLRVLADTGVVWAMAWLGNDHYLTWTSVDLTPGPLSAIQGDVDADPVARGRAEGFQSVPSFTDDERIDWLRMAAAHGHRRSALALGMRLDGEEELRESMGFLLDAFGEGLPEPDADLDSESTSRPLDQFPMTTALLYDAALQLALRASALDDIDEAELWFARSCFCEYWESTESYCTRSGARAIYAEWCEGQERQSQAAALWNLLIDEASRSSLTTSRYMRSETKVYRNDWQFASDGESARHRALIANLRGGVDLSPAQRMRLVTVLCDGYYLSERDSPFLIAHLESLPGGTGFRSQLRHHIVGSSTSVRHAESESSTDVDAAVSVLWWLYRDFQSSWLEFLGFADLANSYRNYLDEECRKPPIFSESTELRGQGPRGVLGSLDEMAEAWDFARAASVEFKELPSGDAEGRGEYNADWWAGRIGLAGSRRYLEGPRSVPPLLRGTGAWMSMWLAADQQAHRRSGRLVDVLDRISFTLNRLIANVEAVEDVWHDYARVWDHLDLQRRRFEVLVDELTS